MKFQNALRVVGGLVIAVGGVMAVAEPAHPAMSQEEMQKAMEAQMAMAKAGPEHDVFKQMEGEWELSSKIFPGPGAPPIEGKGEAEAEMEYDGRFLEMETSGTVMGQPMQGTYIMGYDRHKKQYTIAIWGNVDTALNLGSGTYDAATKTLTYKVHMDDVNGKRDARFVMRQENADRHVLEAYDTMPNGTEIRVLETVFTRDN